MEEVENRLSALCQPDTRLFRQNGKRDATINGESVPRYCLFLIPWRRHCAAVTIKIDCVAPPDCNGYVFYFCSSIVSEICCSEIPELSSRTKTTVEKVLSQHLPKVYLKFDENVFSCVRREPPDDLTSSSCLSRAENCISEGYLSRDAEVGRGEGRTQNHERDRSPLTSSASEDEESQTDKLPDPEVDTFADEGFRVDKLPHPEVKAFTDWFIESIRSPPSEHLHVAHSEILPQRSQKSMSYQSFATQLANLCSRQKKAQDVLANLLKFTAGCIYEAAPRLPTLRIEDNDIGVEDSSPRSTMFRLSKKMAFINQVVDSLRPCWGDQALDIYQLLANTETFKNFYKLSDVQQEEAAKLVVHKLYANPPGQRPSNPYNLVSTMSTMLQLSGKIITQALFPINRRIIVPPASVDKPGTRAANKSTKRRLIDMNPEVDISNKRQMGGSHLGGGGDPTDNALSITTALSIETQTSYSRDAGSSTNTGWDITDPQTTNLPNMGWDVIDPQITDPQTTHIQATNLPNVGWNITNTQTIDSQTTNLPNMGWDIIDPQTTDPQTTDPQTTHTQATNLPNVGWNITDSQTTDSQTTNLLNMGWDIIDSQTTDSQTTHVQATNLPNVGWSTTDPQTTNLPNMSLGVTDPQTTHIQATNLPNVGWNTTDPQTAHMQTTNLPNMGWDIIDPQNMNWDVNNS